jgi:LDH2 family malate/lactate/ureidoglycolate dehydrogenase
MISYSRTLLSQRLGVSLCRRFFSVDQPGFVNISIDEAMSTTAMALKKIGWDDDDAKLQAEIMTGAEICGNNQGLVKMYQPAMMAPSSDASKPSIERDTPTSAVVNANQAPGMLAAVRAADLATEKVLGGISPISIVSSYNSSTSSGQLAFYVNRMAKKGVIGIALANSPEFVAAAPGGKPVFGTNPLAVAVPTSDGTFSFDMATSAIALFGVLTAKSKGEPLPPHVAYDENGNWTTDPNKPFEGGAIATFGGHKGAGLSLCVELLAGALSGGAVLGQVESKKAAKSWGHTFIAIQPDMLVDNFRDKSKSILDTVKASGSNIRIPGERSSQIAKSRMETGVLPIPQKIWDSICKTAKDGLP